MRFADVSSSNSSALPYRYNGKELEAMNGLNQYDYGARRRGAGLPVFTTRDRFSEKYPWQSPYCHAGNNPIKYVDVNGDSTAILLLPGAVGHMAMLIQNEDGKWAYFSANGDDLYNSTDGASGGHPYDDKGDETFESPTAFLKSSFNKESDNKEDKSVNGYEYSEAYILPSTKEQDKIMTEKFKAETKTEYNVFTNNCANTVQKTLNSVGIKTTEDMYVQTTPFGQGYVTQVNPIRPNTAFNAIINNNPNQMHLKRHKK